MHWLGHVVWTLVTHTILIYLRKTVDRLGPPTASSRPLYMACLIYTHTTYDAETEYQSVWHRERISSFSFRRSLKEFNLLLLLLLLSSFVCCSYDYTTNKYTSFYSVIEYFLTSKYQENRICCYVSSYISKLRRCFDSATGDVIEQHRCFQWCETSFGVKRFSNWRSRKSSLELQLHGCSVGTETKRTHKACYVQRMNLPAIQP